MIESWNLKIIEITKMIEWICKSWWIKFAFYCYRNMWTNVANFPSIRWKNRTSNRWKEYVWQKRNSKAKKNNSSHTEIFPCQRQVLISMTPRGMRFFPKSWKWNRQLSLFRHFFRSVPSIDELRLHSIFPLHSQFIVIITMWEWYERLLWLPWSNL